MKELIKKLVEAYGPSGCEEEVRALIAAVVRPLVDELRTDALGNLIALKRGRGGGKRVMVAAHMDEIGLIVTYIDKKGFLRFGHIGGVQPLTVVGNRVRFANGTVGVIGWEKWLLVRDAAPTWDTLYIDVGACDAASASVRVGDAAAFDRSFVDGGDHLISKAMDDRLGCAVTIEALRHLQGSPNDVYAVFTVQEEVGSRGAVVSAFGIEPEIGLAVDVTLTGDTPEARPMAVELGKGPAIKVMDAGMLAHPGIKQWMIDTAERVGIPYRLEVLELGGTDGEEIQRSRAGVPTGCLSIPTRYVHTPSEMVNYNDVLASAKLLAALLGAPIVLP
jgi:endoglucanase